MIAQKPEGLIIGMSRGCAPLNAVSYAEFCVSLGLGSKGFLVVWLPGFLAFLNFFPLERLSVPGICEGILHAFLPLPVERVSSVQRGLCVKGPVEASEALCSHFIDAEAEDQRP